MASASQVVRVLRRARRIPRAQWVAWWRHRPVEPDVVLYEAGSGAGLVDSPYAIFRALVDDPEMSHLRHVWVVADPERRRRAREHVQSLGLDEARVRLVGYRTPGYFRHLATAGYLVNSATFPGELSKRPGQTYLNTWHGTPVKSMGYDTPGGALDAANIMRNFLIADHLISSGPYMTDTMYRGAYRLEGLAPGAVLEVGMPRTDVQAAQDESRRAEVRDVCRPGAVGGHAQPKGDEHVPGDQHRRGRDHAQRPVRVVHHEEQVDEHRVQAEQRARHHRDGVDAAEEVFGVAEAAARGAQPAEARQPHGELTHLVASPPAGASHRRRGGARRRRLSRCR